MAGDKELVHRDITEKIIQSFFEVHTALGGGHFEAVYKKAMVIAMRARGLRCATEVPFAVFFRNENVGDYRADIVAESAVIVEVKAGSGIHEAHRSQTFNYLKASKLKVALLTNFGIKADFERVYLSGTRRRRDVSA